MVSCILFPALYSLQCAFRAGLDGVLLPDGSALLHRTACTFADRVRVDIPELAT